MATFVWGFFPTAMSRGTFYYVNREEAVVFGGHGFLPEGRVW